MKGHGHYPEGDNSFLDNEDHCSWDTCFQCDKPTHIDKSWRGTDDNVRCNTCDEENEV